MIDVYSPLYLQSWYYYLDEASDKGLRGEKAYEYADSKTIAKFSVQDSERS